MLLVRGASGGCGARPTTLRERSQQLLESYRRLEESSLEAVESLNATVEAKDPYTAGHSLRVQRVALAIGARAGAPARRAGRLRFGALFHDIGKIAVPDGILTKPGRLTAGSSSRSSGIRSRARGSSASSAACARRCRSSATTTSAGTAPATRTAWPARRSRSRPSIVGLADAWDAMTTDRRTRRALPRGGVAEVRNGRGTQFAPAVVDAFFAAVGAGRQNSGWTARQSPALLTA